MTLPVRDHASHLQRAISEALHCDRSLRTHLARLASSPVMEDTELGRLPQLQEQRRAACIHLGRRVLDWFAVGGQLTLEAPAIEEGPLEPATASAAKDMRMADPAPDAATANPPDEVDESDDGCEADAMDVGHDPPHAEETAALGADADEADTEEVPPPQPASALDLAALQTRFRMGAGFGSAAKVVVQASIAPSVVRRLGPPLPVRTAANWTMEVRRLRNEVHLRDGWSETSPQAHRELVSYVVARARYLQDEVDIPELVDDADEAGAILRALTVYQAQTERGYVVGLARHQRPSSGTWAKEARVWWNKLSARVGHRTTSSREELLEMVASALQDPHDADAVLDALEEATRGGVGSDDPALLALVEPHAHLLRGTSRLKTLRTTLKQRRKALRSQSPLPEPLESPADMGHPVEWVRGRRMLLFGGDRTSEAMEQAIASLGLSGVQRASGRRVRRLRSKVASIRAGTVDVVVLFREFIGHKVSELVVPACKSNPHVTLVWVEGGYGVAAFMRALKDAAGQPEQPIAAR